MGQTLLKRSGLGAPQVGRGVEGVSVARAHLASLTQELKAGRLSTAAVIAQVTISVVKDG